MKHITFICYPKFNKNCPKCGEKLEIFPIYEMRICKRKECNDDCNKRSNYIFPDPDDN